MCWIGKYAPRVARRDITVYKLGRILENKFISLYQDYTYEIRGVNEEITLISRVNPEFIGIGTPLSLDALWDYDNFYINEGYHSYLTEEMARWNSEEFDDIGIFEIPVGATIYVNYICQEVVSTDIKYLGLLK